AWHVIVHPLSNQHLVTTLGQTARVEIGIRGGRRQREATVFVSDPSKLRLVSGPHVHLVPGATNAVSMTYRAATAGSEALQVHIVDRHTHELISAWRLTATTNMPRIARSYTLTVPVGRPVRRKLEYTNRWPNQRVFAVTSNAPHILSTRDPDALALEGSATGFIGLTVHAVRTPRLEEVLLFVNDEEDVNVETLLVRVKYGPSAYVGL
ncbi:Nphp4, partial [Symbiodinium sp. KB8]